MKNLSDYRAEAREALRGNWFSSVIFVLAYVIIAMVVSGLTSFPVGDPTFAALMTGVSLLGSLLILPLSFGINFGFLNQQRGQEMEIGQLFAGYNKRVWLTLLVKYLYILLWCIPCIVVILIFAFAGTMLFGITDTTTIVVLLIAILLAMIPAYIKIYGYSLVEFLLADNPELSNSAAIRESERLMQGKKMKLFLLDLSFIGWTVLSVFTLFIGMLWVTAYIYQARAAFYQDVIAEAYPQMDVEAAAPMAIEE